MFINVFNLHIVFQRRKLEGAPEKLYITISMRLRALTLVHRLKNIVKIIQSSALNPCKMLPNGQTHYKNLASFEYLTILEHNALKS